MKDDTLKIEDRKKKARQKRKRAKKKSHYMSLSNKGLKFVDLTNSYNRGRLTGAEQFYLDFHKRVYGYDLEATTSEYKKYKKAKDIDFMRNARTEQYRLMSGQLFRLAMRNYRDNYITALKFNGYSHYVDLFEKVYNGMSYSDRYSLFTYTIPEIPIFYKTKGKSESGKLENQIPTPQISSAMEQFKEELLSLAIAMNIDLSKYKWITKDDIKEAKIRLEAHPDED